MADLSDSEKLNILWKYVLYNACQTKPTRFPFEEYIPAKKNIASDDVFYESSLIPIPAAAAPRVVQYLQSQNLTPEDSQKRAWFCLIDTTAPWSKSNAVCDWIGWDYDPSYEVKVYVDAAQTIRVLPNTLGYEWVFDYKYGTLTFLNNVPDNVLSATRLYLMGYVYIGSKQPVLPSLPSLRSTLGYTTAVLNPGSFEEFSLTTGYAAVLVSLSVDSSPSGGDPSCLVEAFSTISRNDTNPYAFKAVPYHTTDDGSWVSYGNVFYGIPNVIIANNETPPLQITYWRITKNGGSGAISLSLTIQSMI